MMVALAMPPPSHIVGSPYRPPRCSSAFTRQMVELQDEAEEFALDQFGVQAHEWQRQP